MSAGVRDVDAVAAAIDSAIAVTADGGEIVLRGHGVEERYDTTEEAIYALRASWGARSGSAPGGAS